MFKGHAQVLFHFTIALTQCLRNLFFFFLSRKHHFQSLCRYQIHHFVRNIKKLHISWILVNKNNSFHPDDN